jgi:hypothetical protein
VTGSRRKNSASTTRRLPLCGMNWRQLRKFRSWPPARARTVGSVRSELESTVQIGQLETNTDGKERRRARPDPLTQCQTIGARRSGPCRRRRRVHRFGVRLHVTCRLRSSWCILGGTLANGTRDGRTEKARAKTGAADVAGRKTLWRKIHRVYQTAKRLGVDDPKRLWRKIHNLLPPQRRHAAGETRKPLWRKIHKGLRQAAMAIAKRKKLDPAFGQFIAAVAKAAKERQKEGQKSGGQTAGRGRPKDDSIVEQSPPSNRAAATKTRAVVAKTFGTNSNSVAKAEKILDEHPELAELVTSGQKSVGAVVGAIKHEEAKKAIAEQVAAAPMRPGYVANYRIFLLHSAIASSHQPRTVSSSSKDRARSK